MFKKGKNKELNLNTDIDLTRFKNIKPCFKDTELKGFNNKEINESIKNFNRKFKNIDLNLFEDIKLNGFK